MNACLDPGTPSNLNGQLSLPLVEPLAANSRLLHLGVLDSGSYVNRRSRRAKQQGKVRETSFVWANVGHSQPSTHPKRTWPTSGTARDTLLEVTISLTCSGRICIGT